MNVPGLGKMGGDADTLMREVRPAEMVEVRDDTGKVVAVQPAAGPVYIVAKKSFPWVWVALGGGTLLFLALRRRRRKGKAKKG